MKKRKILYIILAIIFTSFIIKKMILSSIPEQERVPSEGEEYAKISTSIGNFRVKLFEEKSPKAVFYFKQKASQGYYDRIKIKNINRARGFITFENLRNKMIGLKENMRTDFSEEFENGLYTYKGSVSINKNGDIVIITNSNNDPKNTSERYLKNGGIEEFSKNNAVFGQIYEGEHILRRIMNVEIDKNGKPVKDIVVSEIEIVKNNS